MAVGGGDTHEQSLKIADEIKTRLLRGTLRVVYLVGFVLTGNHGGELKHHQSI